MMKDEIKEIREYISCPQFGDDHYGKWGALRLDQRIKIKDLLDYITNLQEELEEEHRIEQEDFKLIQELEEKITSLQEKNEKLKKQIPTPDNCVPIEKQMRISNVSHDINYKYFKTLYEKASKDIVIDDLVYKCEDMQKLIETNEKLYIEKETYKSRIDKAIELISKEFLCYDNESDEYIQGKKAINILNGGE